jgi:protein-S-isoprenylcysteine O-methyltransferase Ste14
VLVRGEILPAAFGVVAIVLALLFAVSFPLRAAIPEFDPLETAATLGVLLWTLVSGVALLLPRRSREAESARAYGRGI